MKFLMKMNLLKNLEIGLETVSGRSLFHLFRHFRRRARGSLYIRTGSLNNSYIIIMEAADNDSDEENVSVEAKIEAAQRRFLRQDCCLCRVPWKTLLRQLVYVFRMDLSSNKRIFLRLCGLFHRVVTSVFESSSSPSTCPTNLAFVRGIAGAKFHLLAALLRLNRESDDDFLRLQSRRLFTVVFRCIPCRDSDCERSCLRITHYLVKSLSNASASFDFSVAALEDVINEDVKDGIPKATPSNRHHRLKFSEALVAKSLSHGHRLRTVLAAQTRTEWRKWKDAFSDSSHFLAFWRCFVSVKSNLGIASSRESISTTRDLVVKIFESDTLTSPDIRRLRLEIVNETLCYGSTLALQNDVPDEIASISQLVLKTVASKDVFANMTDEDGLCRSFSFLGEREIGDDDEDAKRQRFRGLSQNVSLIVLKSLAVTLRQATCCSSGSESDSSHASSRGEGLDDREAEAIERGVSRCVDAWKSWLTKTNRVNLVSAFLDCFMDQDDNLIEGLLCLLDVETGLTALTQCRVTPFDAQPIDFFAEFVAKCSWDASLVIDYLLSNETCFLLYFLKFLKFCCKYSSSLAISPPLKEFLLEVNRSLSKLSRQGLFPYDIVPVSRWLQKVAPIKDFNSK